MINGTAYRLIGISLKQFSAATEADQANLLNSNVRNITHIENAMETYPKPIGNVLQSIQNQTKLIPQSVNKPQKTIGKQPKKRQSP